MPDYDERKSEMHRNFHNRSKTFINYTLNYTAQQYSHI